MNFSDTAGIVRRVGEGVALGDPEGWQRSKGLLRQPKSARLMEERGKLLFMAACHAAEAWGGFQGHEADGGIAVEVEGARGQEAVPFRDLEPFWLLHQLPNLPAAHLAIESGWRGPCQTFALGRESSLASGPAGGQARRWLERGEARCVIVGRVASGRADVEIWERV